MSSKHKIASFDSGPSLLVAAILTCCPAGHLLRLGCSRVRLDRLHPTVHSYQQSVPRHLEKQKQGKVHAFAISDYDQRLLMWHLAQLMTHESAGHELQHCAFTACQLLLHYAAPRNKHLEWKITCSCMLLPAVILADVQPWRVCTWK